MFVCLCEQAVIASIPGWVQIVNEDMQGSVAQLQAELKAMRSRLLEANG